MDLWGKWTFIGSFVSLVLMVALSFRSGTDVIGVQAIGDMFAEAGTGQTINFYLGLGPGFLVMLIATVGSILVGQAMTACNRYAHDLGEPSRTLFVQAGARNVKLCNALRPEGYWQGKMFAYGPLVAMALSLALVVYGLRIDVFAFVFEGFGGYLKGDDSIRAYSVVSMGIAISTASEHPSSISVVLAQIVFFTLVVFAVLSYFVLLIVLWAAPLSHKMQSRVFVACQTLAAWSGIEVFLVAVAGVMQMSQYMDFMIGDSCNSINPLLAKLPIAKDIPGGPTCFHLKTELREGFYILLFSAVVSAITGRFIIARCKTALGMDAKDVDSYVAKSIESNRVPPTNLSSKGEDMLADIESNENEVAVAGAAAAGAAASPEANATAAAAGAGAGISDLLKSSVASAGSSGRWSGR